MQEIQTPVVQVEKLRAWYGKKQALHDIDLAIDPLSVTALIGPSGCGKSTFLRCLNRMHEDLPDARAEGQVLIEGFDIYASSVHPRHLRRAVGMVFQHPNPLPHLSIWDNVALGLRMHGLARGKELGEQVEWSLTQAALWEEVKDRLHVSAASLSGGQQQRLCIARAIALSPRLLLMDEPCSALDPISTMQIEEHLQSLKERYTVVIVTHNMQQAGRVADTTAFFLSGRLIEVNTTATLFDHPRRKETEDYVAGRFS